MRAVAVLNYKKIHDYLAFRNIKCHKIINAFLSSNGREISVEYQSGYGYQKSEKCTIDVETYNRFGQKSNAHIYSEFNFSKAEEYLENLYDCYIKVTDYQLDDDTSRWMVKYNTTDKQNQIAFIKREDLNVSEENKSNITYDNLKTFNTVQTTQNKNIIIVKLKDYDCLVSMNKGKYYVVEKVGEFYELLTLNKFKKHGEKRIAVRANERFKEYPITHWIEARNFNSNGCWLIPCLSKNVALDISRGELYELTSIHYEIKCDDQEIYEKLNKAQKIPAFELGIKTLLNNSYSSTSNSYALYFEAPEKLKIGSNDQFKEEYDLQNKKSDFFSPQNIANSSIRILPPPTSDYPKIMINDAYQYQMRGYQHAINQLQVDKLMKDYAQPIYVKDVDFLLSENDKLNALQNKILNTHTHPTIKQHQCDPKIGMDPTYLLI